VVALLILTALVTVAMALGRSGDEARTVAACPEGFIPANLTLPQARDVQINVYNGTTRTGLAGRIGENFANRDFEVIDWADHGSEVEGVAQLHYGPGAVGAAQLVRAYFLNDATMVFDITREDDVVDVVLGTAFQQLATPTEVSQAIAAAGNPAPPEGTCPAPAGS
jgi:hypothetical protein